MKIKVILIALLLQAITDQIFSQDNRCGDTFDQSKYPADSFAVKQRTYAFGKTQIKVTVLHANIEHGEELVWVEQRSHKRILKSKLIGYLGSESGVGILANQPLKNCFIIRQANEFSGVYYLMTMEGKWYEIPGGEIWLNKAKNILYTAVPEECGGCLVAKFSLPSKKLETKMSDGKGNAWAEAKEAEGIRLFTDVNEWINWEKF